MGNICPASFAIGGGSEADKDNMILARKGLEPLTNDQLEPFNAFFDMIFEPTKN